MAHMIIYLLKLVQIDVDNCNRLLPLFIVGTSPLKAFREPLVGVFSVEQARKGIRVQERINLPLLMFSLGYILKNYIGAYLIAVDIDGKGDNLDLKVFSAAALPHGLILKRLSLVKHTPGIDLRLIPAFLRN